MRRARRRKGWRSGGRSTDSLKGVLSTSSCPVGFSSFFFDPPPGVGEPFEKFDQPCHILAATTQASRCQGANCRASYSTMHSIAIESPSSLEKWSAFDICARHGSRSGQASRV
eukprot:2814042-Rhodomonas_salina.1